MFRFMRVLSTSRLPMRIESQAQRGIHQPIQKVKFARPPAWSKWRQIVCSGVAFYLSYEVYCRLVLEPLGVAAEEASKIISKEKDEEEEDSSLFLPFIGTTKKLPSQPYSGSDPEWQEFIRISKDHALADRMRHDLADIVKTIAERHKLLTARCGNGMGTRRFWLDLDFPQHPPPEFERSGIEITDDGIYWTTKPIDSLTVSRIQQAIWPSALLQSAWSFTKNSERKPSKDLSMEKFYLLRSPNQLMRQKKVLTAAPTDPTYEEKVKKASQILNNHSSPGHPVTWALQAHFHKAVTAFKAKLQQTWKPASSYPPRGCVMVSGLVELDAPRAWLVFDVKAAWDPKIKSYDYRSMSDWAWGVQVNLFGLASNISPISHPNSASSPSTKMAEVPPGTSLLARASYAGPPPPAPAPARAPARSILDSLAAAPPVMFFALPAQAEEQKPLEYEVEMEWRHEEEYEYFSEPPWLPKQMEWLHDWVYAGYVSLPYLPCPTLPYPTCPALPYPTLPYLPCPTIVPFTSRTMDRLLT
ncbi:hypothetical protein B7494_g1516, partial [Chlorociboria aeruginascens]